MSGDPGGNPKPVTLVEFSITTARDDYVRGRLSLEEFEGKVEALIVAEDREAA